MTEKELLKQGFCSEDSRYDIAIIGLGPAGATLARLLDQKYRVIAIDKKDPGADSCCGNIDRSVRLRRFQTLFDRRPERRPLSDL